MKSLILASSSAIYGSGYLEYLLPELEQLYKDIKEIVFIPYARPSGISYEEYTLIAKKAFLNIGIVVKGIHEFENETMAIRNSNGIFVGGGNTFVLVKELYERNLMDALRNTIENGVPYLGTSAGSNICGVTMQTTNDMPIVMPKSFTTLNIIPFNINAHYLDPDPNSSHKGETREVRINEFHTYNNIPVLGLREGSWLDIKDFKVILKGRLTARLFKKGKTPFEAIPETNLIELV